ncbi:helix-turn-helix domain-containing protein [Modestobacter sp. SYSU DS0657]
MARPPLPHRHRHHPGYQPAGTGLRREELAQLAGLSVDYVLRLEQGRATSPSAQVVTALAGEQAPDRLSTALLTRAVPGHCSSNAGRTAP